MKKIRLDELLIARGIASTLKEARAAIMSGIVFHENRRVDKAGDMLAESAELEIRDNSPQYVSRGGMKLEGALEDFDLDPKGKICVDLGSSTGGFTDCLLQKGAAEVYAFDVGKGLLDWRLRGDSRILLREGFNVRYLTPEDLPRRVDLLTADLSFISLALILPALKNCLPDTDLLLLVKPQFEGKPQEVDKGGIVRDETRRTAILNRTVTNARQLGFEVLGTAPSRLTGQKGNQEYFLHLRAMPGGKQMANSEGQWT